MSGDDVTHGLAIAMADLKEMAAPIEEAARGMREDLSKNKGWTNESADRMACEWYVLVMRNMQAQAGKDSDDED